MSGIITLKNGMKISRLTTIAGAKKLIKVGEPVMVFSISGTRLYIGIMVQTLEQLEAAKRSRSRYIGNLAVKGKPAYYKIEAAAP